MPTLTITLTTPAATRVSKAVQRTRGLENPATAGEIKEHVITQLKRLVRLAEAAEAAEAAVDPNEPNIS